ncbi:MAG: hypothetical protein ONB05_04455 [candidate division KSB1 bacterium]|nr:hypothetical protein [candidate division KSB1 bacterium]
MIHGYIDEIGTPLIDVTVEGTRSKITLPALIDTGFDGDLSLPIDIAVELGLELVTSIPLEFADGTITEDALVFAGLANLNEGKPRNVEILLTSGDHALIGRNWFVNGSLKIDYKKGIVTINET